MRGLRTPLGQDRTKRCLAFRGFLCKIGKASRGRQRLGQEAVLLFGVQAIYAINFLEICSDACKCLQIVHPRETRRTQTHTWSSQESPNNDDVGARSANSSGLVL